MLRDRIATACDNCRSSKRKCDGSSPCRICINRGKVQSCTYTSREQRKRAHEQRERRRKSSLPGGSALSGSFNDEEPDATAIDANLNRSTQDLGPTAHGPPAGRMFAGPKGERIYLNSTAGLSFLHFLKATLKERLGSAPFVTDAAGEGIYDAGEFLEDQEPVVLDGPTKEELVECFSVSTSGFLDVCSHVEIEQFLLATASLELSATLSEIQLAMFDMIIAIGAQTRAASSNDNSIAVSKFLQARSVAFKHHLENPSVDLVRLFLLMAFYMVGASRRHAAVMHIGIAATTAVMLGLHETGQYAKLSPREFEIRWRTYRGLLLMDMMNATLLGRQLVTPLLTRGYPVWSGDQSYNTAMEAESDNTTTFDVCYIIYDYVHRIDHLDTASSQLLVEKLHRRIERWRQDTREVKKITKVNLSSWTSRASAAGTLHAACICYHTIIFATRPALINGLLVLVRRPKSDDLLDSVSLLDNLAKRCIDNCICAANMCFDAFEAGLLLNNMCHLIRPLLFEVGLLLGFFFAVSPLNAGCVEDSFRKTRKLLKHLAKVASLSKVFYDILSSLLDAIVARRNEMTRKLVSPTAGPAEALVIFDLSNQENPPRNEDFGIQIPLETAPSGEAIDQLGASTLSDSYLESPEWQFLSQQYSTFMPMETFASVFDGLG